LSLDAPRRSTAAAIFLLLVIPVAHAGEPLATGFLQLARRFSRQI
jgi:hypothetical protein